MRISRGARLRMTFDYWMAQLLHPTTSRLGFPRMGLGIERRSVQLEEFWKLHLTQSRSRIAAWISESRKLGATEVEVIVLGAGRLLDFDIHHALQHCVRITLVDADPTTIHAWRPLLRRNKKSIRAVTCELTGSLSEWRNQLQALERQSFAEFLAALERWPSPRSTQDIATQLVGSEPDAAGAQRPKPTRLVLSLNILSQLPVMWQDIVFDELRLRFGPLDESQQQAAVLALIRSAGSLVSQHFELLALLRAQQVLLLTDIAALYYEPLASGAANQRFQATAEPPIERVSPWTTKLDAEDWRLHIQTASLLKPEMELASLLAGYDPLALAREFGFALCESALCETAQPQHWLWHIKPAGFENSSEGVVHHVAGLCLRRS